MRKLILKMSVSIDGFVCGPNGEVDWIFRTMDDEVARWTMETLWDTDLHIMGRRTYQDMAAYWPTSKEPFAEPMNKIPKIAFSKRGFLDKPGIDSTTRAFKDAALFVKGSSEPEALQTDNKQEGNWADPQLLSGNLVEEITGLKQMSGKNILAHGGASFAQSLAGFDLIDEYRLLFHPVALGDGLPLFAALPKPAYLKLIDIVTFKGGSAAHVYQPVR